MNPKDINIWIPSNRPQLAEISKSLILPYQSKIYDGSGYESFTKLMNECIDKSENEIIIISSDKARANYTHIDKIIDLLNQGFGLVGLYRLGFFGFKKDLIRKIGFFDERYIGGGYEDNDFIIRMKEADIAYYESEEIPFVYIYTTWNYDKPNSIAKRHFENKWIKNIPISITRTLPEEKYKYNIGEYKNTHFLNFSKSIMMKYANTDWINMKIIT